MEQLKTPEKSYNSRLWANTRRIASWGIAWVAATALMGLGPKFFWNRAMVFTLLAAGLEITMGVGLILAHKKYITELDELQRKVYFNALAITVGVAVIAGVPWQVMDRYRVIPFHADTANLVVLMSVTYVVSVVYGNWRYR